jgi:pimeloyl-ACP methyl ester carboxylesterase
VVVQYNSNGPHTPRNKLMPSLIIDEQTMFYQIRGQGRPLLIMHGWTDTGDDLFDLADRLSGYQVILPDLPGYGRSVLPYRTYPDDFYHRDCRLMAAFLDALSLRDVHIAGFSDGGEISLLMGVTRPDLCRSVMAWGAVGAFTMEDCERSRFQGKLPSWFDDALKAKHPGQDVFAWAKAWPDAFCAMIERFNGDISLSQAKEIACPLMIMLGALDSLNPPAAGERYIAASQHGTVLRRFQAFEEAGHGVHTDQPEAFAAAYLSFLQAVDEG